MGKPRDFSNSSVLLSSVQVLDGILQSTKIIKFNLPSYLFLVGLKNYECKYVEKPDAQVIKCKNGRAALRFVKNLKGTILGVIVGENIEDMTTLDFIEKMSKLIFKRVIYREDECTELFIK